MIRINLLPGPKGHKAKPQYDVRAQALLGVGLLFIALAGCWWYSAALDDEISVRQAEKLDKEKQVAQLKEQVRQVSEFESRKKVLEDKNRIIDELEKSRVGPVKVLDHVSQSLEPLKVWLVRMTVTGKDIDVERRRSDNTQSISDLIRRCTGHLS
jgi:type IV pilus assembly protein PilN